MQPNSYYGFGMTPAQQSQSVPQAPAQPQPGAPKPVKKHNGLTPVVWLLLLVCLGLGAYIAIDKLLLKPAPQVIVQESSTSISEPLSKIQLPDGDQHDIELAKALVGRIFVSDAAHEQTIEFNTNVDYTFDYYKDPTNDLRKVQPSEAHGQYAVKGNVISLISGDRFTITNDYLIKTADDLSNNINVVYFDAQQAKYVYKGINSAFDSYITTQVKVNKGSIAIDRTYIDFGTFICKVGDSRLTNADNFYCTVDYALYATKDAADKAIADSQKQVEIYQDDKKDEKKTGDTKVLAYKNFVEYCNNNTSIADFTKGGTCNEDYSIRAKANIIVRITDDTYKITGLFR